MRDARVAKCKHKSRKWLAWWSRSMEWYPFVRETDGEPGATICLDCGHWLSLGPAREDGPNAAAVVLEKDTLINWVPLAPFDFYRDCDCIGCQKRYLANDIVATEAA